MSSESGSAGTGALRILVAEDQAIIRLDLRGILEKHGLIVCAEARDGEEAVELARTSHPDVALLDMRMPTARRNRGGAEDVRGAADPDRDAHRVLRSRGRREGDRRRRVRRIS